jgi:thiamine phosphate synthase YjbQ (UPF0047 family)
MNDQMLIPHLMVKRLVAVATADHVLDHLLPDEMHTVTTTIHTVMNAEKIEAGMVGIVIVATSPHAGVAEDVIGLRREVVMTMSRLSRLRRIS